MDQTSILTGLMHMAKVAHKLRVAVLVITTEITLHLALWDTVAQAEATTLAVAAVAVDIMAVAVDFSPVLVVVQVTSMQAVTPINLQPKIFTLVTEASKSNINHSFDKIIHLSDKNCPARYR
jgi:hypothetical protein